MSDILSSIAREVRRRLFMSGPLPEEELHADVKLKAGCIDLVRLGHALTQFGWITLTRTGMVQALEAGLGKEKKRFILNAGPPPPAT